MDFKSLISKIESIDGPIETPKAPAQAEPIRLDEDTELRVLAGVMPLTESVIAEKAVSKAQQKFMGMVHATQKGEKAPSKDVAKVAKEMGKKDAKDFASTKHKGLPEKKTDESVEEGQEDLKKVGDKAKTTHGTMTKTATGLKHERSYSKEKDEDDDAPKSKKAKKESIDPEQFKAKFTKMVEAKKEEKKDKKAKKMDEGSKPDFLDLDKDGNKKEPMKKAAADKGGDKKDGKKGMSAKQEKYFGKKNESVKTSKKVVAESVEQKLSFRDMVKLVQESGGQQQIDPVDKALFNWATRVAQNKLGEGMKAEIYAGLIYERNGGVFEMYDVLAEDTKKKVNEGIGSMFQKAGSMLGLSDKKNPEELRKIYLQNVRKDKSERKGSVDNFVSGVRELTYFNKEDDMDPSDETLMQAYKERVLDQGGVRAADKAKAPKARNDMTGAL